MVEDEPQSGYPASVRGSTNVDHIRTFICQDQLLTIRMIIDEININEFTVHQIVTQDLNMRKVCAKMIPKNLNDNQKVHRETKCQQKFLNGLKLNLIFIIVS
jgi:hypothetical protein